MADKGKMNKTSSISFTLPISCQICLGKVKQPIVCPNQHVFCSTCIELWLQHNQQCPTCRIPITPENPCKQVLGGPNFSEESAESTPVSTPALRRTRLDLLYKEYEDEIERLNNEVDTLKTQKQDLQRQVSQAQQAALSTSSPSTSSLSPSCKGMKLKGKEVKNDADVMLVLTSKLKEATATYEKVKHDMDKMKEVNLRLRDENASLLRETGRLKQLVASRSPHKYERYAISAQASKIEQCEKEIKQLKRALERSDIYVEELESKVDTYKAKYGEIQIEEAENNTSGLSNDDPSRSELENADLVGACGKSGARAKLGPRSNSVIKHNKIMGKAVRVKQELVDGWDETEGGESSFQLEQPSPITPASSLRRLTLESGTKTSSQHNSSSTSTASSTTSGSSLRSCTRQLDFDVQNQVSTPQVSAIKSHQDAILEVPDFSTGDTQSTPSNADTTLGRLDYSITPEFEACTRLLKAAEERVHQRKQTSLEGNSYEAVLGFQPGTSLTVQPTAKPVDYKSSYILPDCDPTFQLNPVLVPQTSTVTESTNRLAFHTQGHRPPSAPTTSNFTDTIAGELFPQSTMPSHGLANTTRPNSAPVVGAQSSPIQVVYQSQGLSTIQNAPSVAVSSNTLQVVNTSLSSSYLPPQSSSQGSLTMPTQPYISAMPLNMQTPLPEYSQSRPNLEIMSRTRGASKQQKTVYVLSGSRIAPLGDRRKRSSSIERREQNTSNNLCSPSKTQKF